MLASQQRGASYTAEQDELKGTGLYTYSNWNGLSDWSIRNQVGTRALGGLQWVGGNAQAVGGVATASTCETGIGCVVAGSLFTSGVDNANAGWQTLINGTATPTWGGQVLQGLGLSPNAAELVYGATQLASPMGEAYLVNRAVNSQIAANQLARMSYTPIEQFGAQGLQATPEIMQTPQVQAIVNQYVEAGASADRAMLYTESMLQTGLSLLETINVNQDIQLIKLVPKNASGSDNIGDYSPFFITKQQYNNLAGMSSSQIANYLGLPAEQGIRGSQFGFDVYSMTPKPGQSPTVFSSEVAPVQQGAYSAWGGGQQILVPNRSAWTDPNINKIGEIKGSQ